MAVLLLPGVLTIYFSFNAGGFFAGSPAVANVVLVLVLLLRVALADRPFEGLSRGLALALGALALFAAWTLVSAAWSEATWRALQEFDRALLYLLALLLLGSLARTPERVRILLWGLAAALVAVCLAGFVSSTFPALVPAASGGERLSFPVTYWNALGLQAALATALCVHLTSSRHEPRLAVVLGAAAVPPVVATLVLTLSRGAIVAAVVALIAYVVLARPGALVSGLAGTVPAGAVAAVVAYNADVLAGEGALAPAATAEGSDLALTVAVLSVSAAILRTALLLTLDPRFGSIRLLPRAPRRPVLAGVAVSALLAAVVAAVAFDLPAILDRQYTAFAETPVANEGSDIESRLTQVGGNGRADYWRIALDAFREHKLGGAGGGTYELLWAQERPRAGHVLDAHSLYLEVLAELGIVGAVLFVVALATVLAGLALRARGRHRSLYAALFAATLAWAVHAGVDWDWEMPAVTFWLFAAGGAALAAAPSERPLLRPPGRLARSVLAIALLVLALVPALVMVSQLHLSTAQEGLRKGDCRQAIDSARASASVLSVRPEPYETLGYCNVRVGNPEVAVAAFRSAIDRDPGSWRYWYGLAVSQGAARTDPRPAARRALELNPRGREPRALVELFRTDDPDRWKSQAEAAPLPLDLLSR